jgi:hypothetical protein
MFTGRPGYCCGVLVVTLTIEMSWTSAAANANDIKPVNSNANIIPETIFFSISPFS